MTDNSATGWTCIVCPHGTRVRWECVRLADRKVLCTIAADANALTVKVGDDEVVVTDRRTTEDARWMLSVDRMKALDVLDEAIDWRCNKFNLPDPRIGPMYYREAP